MSDVTQMLSRLPRPVFLASNAYGVDWEAIAPPVEQKSTTNIKRPSPKQKQRPRPETKTSPVDVPTWDGPNDDVIDQEETVA